jgi:hypothetical protein
MAALWTDHFQATCPDDLQASVVIYSDTGDYAWGSTQFLKAITARLDVLVDGIRRNQGEVVVWFDVDIQFYGRCSARMLECLGDRDLCFQSEFWPPNGKINVGVIVIRCNPKTLAFFEKVRAQDFSSLRYYDQTLIQNLLDAGEEGVRWGVLPTEFWAYSHGGMPPDGLLLHHANMEGLLAKKIEQLNAVRKYVQARRRFSGAHRLIDRIHHSVLASQLARCIPLRWRVYMKRKVHHGARLIYRPSYEG